LISALKRRRPRPRPKASPRPRRTFLAALYPVLPVPDVWRAGGSLAGCDDNNASLPICAAEFRPALTDDAMGALRRRLSLVFSSRAGWPAILRQTDPLPAAPDLGPSPYPPGFDPSSIAPYLMRRRRRRPSVRRAGRPGSGLAHARARAALIARSFTP
jgi:hypothetical protein